MPSIYNSLGLSDPFILRLHFFRLGHVFLSRGQFVYAIGSWSRRSYKPALLLVACNGDSRKRFHSFFIVLQHGVFQVCPHVGGKAVR